MEEAGAGEPQQELDLDPAELRGGLEALLFVDGRPGRRGRRWPARCAARCEQVRAGAGRAGRRLRRAARRASRCAGWGRGGGSTPARSTPPVVERYLLDGQRSRLTQAALETLAVIAYRQPVTRARVSAIRGVGVDGVMRTLISRGLVQEAGADPDTGGGLYVTTPLFLERLGLTGLDELPELAPLLPDPRSMLAEGPDA